MVATKMRFGISKFSYVAVLSILSLAACGGDDGKNGVRPDSAPTVDTPPMSQCTAESTYTPAFMSSGAGQFAINYPATTGTNAAPHTISFGGGMNADIDALRIFLFQGFGPFATGDKEIKAGTFQLTGDDAKFSSCGACVLVATNVSQQNGTTDWYMANAGTLELTSVGGAAFNGQFTGTLMNGTFVHVGKDGMGLPSDMTADTCATAVTSASFNVMMMAGTATGKTGDDLIIAKRQAVLSTL